MSSAPSSSLLRNLTILIVDNNSYMRRVTRTMLTNLGVRLVIEVADGIAAIEQINKSNPDVMLLDWNIPLLNGFEVLRIIRAPGVFPYANLPIIVLTGYVKRCHVLDALRLGVHEILLKPTSSKALFDRLASVIMKPRPMLKVGSYYLPMPRNVPHELHAIADALNRH